LKAKISPINVFELERLIDKTKNAETMIKDKDALFIMGNTGCGKSTNILKFLGYSIYPAKIGNFSTLLPTTKLKEKHKTFYTSPEAKSCTRYINAVPIPNEMYKIGVSEFKKTLVICDTPGFGDSAGV
jgi:predicted GTPase